MDDDFASTFAYVMGFVLALLLFVVAVPVMIIVFPAWWVAKQLSDLVDDDD